MVVIFIKLWIFLNYFKNSVFNKKMENYEKFVWFVRERALSLKRGREGQKVICVEMGQPSAHVSRR
jgi:hypothetical protein